MTTAVLTANAKQQFFDNNGQLATGALLFTYAAGTTTKQDTYTNQGAATPNANPIVLDSRGEANVWLDPALNYKFTLAPSTDTDPPTNAFWTVDNIVPFGTGGGGSQTFTDVTVTNDLTVSGNATIGGNLSVTGDITGVDDITINDDATIGGDLLVQGTKLNALVPGMYNGTITAAAAANAITIAVKTMAGADPSATDPVSVVRRNETITTGTTHIVNITAATSTVISSGSTLGCTSAEKVRIHVGLLRNAGTGMELFYWTSTVTANTTIKSPSPAELVTTTAEGGAGAADSTQTQYSTTARTSQPWTYLGYIEATSGATAGQWSSIDKIVNWQPGVPMPGDIVQLQSTYTGAVATGTTIVPGDDTVPTSSEGDQFMTQAITCKSTMNKCHVYVKAQFTSSLSDTSMYMCLFQDAGAAALAVSAGTAAANAADCPSFIDYLQTVGTTSATTWKVRAGGNQAQTTTFNGGTGARVFGGTFNSFIKVEEIHV